MNFCNFLRKKKKEQQILKKVAEQLTFKSSTSIHYTQVVKLNKLKQKCFFKNCVYGCQVENVTYLALVTPDENVILRTVYWDYDLAKGPLEKGPIEKEYYEDKKRGKTKQK